MFAAFHLHWVKLIAMKKFTILLLSCLCTIAMQAQEDTSLQQYTGVYKFPDGSVVPSVEIVLVNGALSANSSMGSAPLEKISRDTFNLPTYNGMIYFTRTAGKITGLKVETQEVVLEGKKDGLEGFGLLAASFQKTSDCLNLKTNRNPSTLIYTGVFLQEKNWSGWIAGQARLLSIAHSSV
jgi:hypothetical protein